MEYYSFILRLLPLFSTIAFLLLLTCFNISAANSNNSNVTTSSSSTWYPARATWYGDPHGAGSDGGACGYGDAVENPPFSSMVSAGGPSLFKSGHGCGACYQVKCTGNGVCSGEPVTVAIADLCPGCLSEQVHFDMSGTAFGAMAIPGEDDRIRDVGVLTVQYMRVECKYPGYDVAFYVDSGSNPYYFAVAVEYEGGDGDLWGLDLMQGGSDHSWLPMQHSWGAVWMLSSSGSQLRAPFSIRLTTLSTHRTAIASRVIPIGWKPGSTYRFRIQFSSVSA
ncbi:expansin-B18-like [Ananas comosus]|uniref:Expansin-B18-like n=1 Tax=Ananas comosus TaxID=4615 RepID=A0A6P5FH84_ANACO|nr:expansin-B18-like [Ananas comosus]